MRELAALAMLMIPSLAWAEVMDKELGLPAVLGWVLVGAAATFCAARWLPWALAVVLPIATLFFVGQYSELLDAHVGPAILAEAGRTYVAISWLSPLAIVGALAYGLYIRRRVRNEAT